MNSRKLSARRRRLEARGDTWPPPPQRTETPEEVRERLRENLRNDPEFQARVSRCGAVATYGTPVLFSFIRDLLVWIWR